MISFIYYMFIKSIQGLAPIGYRTCHQIIQKYNTKYTCHIKAHVIVTIVQIQYESTNMGHYIIIKSQNNIFTKFRRIMEEEIC